MDITKFYKSILNIAMLMSVVLFIAILAIGGRGYWVADSLFRYENIKNESNIFRENTFRLFSAKGSLYICAASFWRLCGRESKEKEIVAFWQWETYDAAQIKSWKNKNTADYLGFQYNRHDGSKTFFIDAAYRQKLLDDPYFSSRTINTKSTELLIPYWLLLLLTGILPLVRFYYWQKNMRKLDRLSVIHCNKCGYDLRVHKPGGRCPECGTAIPIL